MKIITLLIALALTGCASLKSAYSTPEKRAAIGKALRTDAVNILGHALVGALTSATQNAITGSGEDMAHAAAQGAWSSVSGADLVQLITDFTGGKSPELASIAANVVQSAVNQGINRVAAKNAAAAVISSVAMSR